MNYQELFYFLGSVYMFLGIVLMIVLLGTIIYLVQKARELQAVVREKTEKIAQMTHQPSIVVRYAGHLIAKGIRNYFSSLAEKNKK